VALFHLVADGLNIVSVGIANECGVVTRVVFGPQTGLVKHFGAHDECSIKELTHGYTTRRDKGDVTLSKALADFAWTNPELWLRVDAITHYVPKIHDPASSEWRENRVIEDRTLWCINTLNR
jgi:hypothetical protein